MSIYGNHRDHRDDGCSGRGAWMVLVMLSLVATLWILGDHKEVAPDDSRQ